MKNVTKIAAKVITVAIAVTMLIGGTTVFADQLPCNTRTNDECNEYTLLPLNTNTDGHGYAGGEGDVHWTVDCGASNDLTSRVAGAARTSVDDFINRLYANTLHRAPDDAGRAYWVRVLGSSDCTGTDVAMSLLSSDEFVNQNLSDEQFVTTLYNVFFGRTPDQAGLTHWVNQLQNGMTRAQVISGFTGSSEWTIICNCYGISA